MGCKYLFLIVSVLFFVNLSLISADTEEEEVKSIEMLKKLYQFERMNKEKDEIGEVGDIRNGVLNVKAITLKNIKPQNVYYKGEIEAPETMDIPFSKSGKIVSIIGKGEYVLNPIYDDKGNLIREGNSIAILDKEEIAMKLKSAKATRRIIDMSQDYISKMTMAQEKLASQNFITSFALQAARMELMTALIEYESKSRDLDSFIKNYQDNFVKSPYSGLVVDVYAGEGDIAEEGGKAIRVVKMDTVMVKIPFDVDLVNIEAKKNMAYVFPNGSNVSVDAMIDFYQNDRENIYAYVPNEIIDANKLTTEQKELPKVFDLYSISDLENRNIESFYLPDYKPKRNPLLFAPVESIRQDTKGSYVFKIKNLQLTSGMERLPRLYKVEKVYVELGNVFSNLYYPYSVEHSKVSRSLLPLDGKSLEKWDMVVGKDDGRVEDGNAIVIVNAIWKFYPGQTVRVQIPTLTKPGLWVPRNALLHNDINLNYVYLIKSGFAKLIRVNVLGEYEGYCLINSQDIEDGSQIVILKGAGDEFNLTQLIYDGIKVKVLRTQDAPEFLAHDHVDENLYQKRQPPLESNSREAFKLRSVIIK